MRIFWCRDVLTIALILLSVDWATACFPFKLCGIFKITKFSRSKSNEKIEAVADQSNQTNKIKINSNIAARIGDTRNPKQHKLPSTVAEPPEHTTGHRHLPVRTREKPQTAKAGPSGRKSKAVRKVAETTESASEYDRALSTTHSLLNYVLKPQKSEHKLVGGRLEFEDTEKLFNEHKPLELSEAITRMHTLDSTLTATFEEQHGLSNIFEEKKWIQKAMECWLVIYYSDAFKTLSKNTEINQHILSDAKGHSGNDHSEQIAVGAQFVERTNKRFNEIGTHIRSSSITLLVSVELANKLQRFLFDTDKDIMIKQFNGLFDLFQSIGDLLLLQKTEAIYFGPILHYFAIALDIFDLSMTVFDRHYLTKAADYYPVLILLSQYIEILPHEKHTDQNDINESHEDYIKSLSSLGYVMASVVANGFDMGKERNFATSMQIFTSAAEIMAELNVRLNAMKLYQNLSEWSSMRAYFRELIDERLQHFYEELLAMPKSSSSHINFNKIMSDAASNEIEGIEVYIKIGTALIAPTGTENLNHALRHKIIVLCTFLALKSAAQDTFISVEQLSDFHEYLRSFVYEDGVYIESTVKGKGRAQLNRRESQREIIHTN